MSTTTINTEPYSCTTSTILKVTFQVGFTTRDIRFFWDEKNPGGPFQFNAAMAFSVSSRLYNWTCGLDIKWKGFLLRSKQDWADQLHKSIREWRFCVYWRHEGGERCQHNKRTRAKLADLAEFWTCQGRPLCTFERQDSLITSHFHPVYSCKFAALIPFAKAEFMVERLVGFYILNMYIPTLLGVILRQLMIEKRQIRTTLLEVSLIPFHSTFPAN